MAGTGPGIAETAGAQEDGMQAGQLLNLPRTRQIVSTNKTSGVCEGGRTREGEGERRDGGLGGRG